MRRAVLVFGFILSIAFQGMALAGQVLGWDRSGDTAHSVLHADGVAHHHDDAGTAIPDASEESQQHVQHDCCTTVALMPPSSAGSVGALGAARGAANAPPEGHDSAFLEGLRRPPR